MGKKAKSKNWDVLITARASGHLLEDDMKVKIKNLDKFKMLLHHLSQARKLNNQLIKDRDNDVLAIMRNISLRRMVEISTSLYSGGCEQFYIHPETVWERIKFVIFGRVGGGE